MDHKRVSFPRHSRRCGRRFAPPSIHQDVLLGRSHCHPARREIDTGRRVRFERFIARSLVANCPLMNRQLDFEEDHPCSQDGGKIGLLAAGGRAGPAAGQKTYLGVRSTAACDLHHFLRSLKTKFACVKCRKNSTS